MIKDVGEGGRLGKLEIMEGKSWPGNKEVLIRGEAKKKVSRTDVRNGVLKPLVTFGVRAKQVLVATRSSCYYVYAYVSVWAEGDHPVRMYTTPFPPHSPPTTVLEAIQKRATVFEAMIEFPFQESREKTEKNNKQLD